MTSAPLSIQLYNYTGRQWPYQVAAYREGVQVWVTEPLICQPALTPGTPYLYIDPQYEMTTNYTYYVATVSPGSPVLSGIPEPYPQGVLPFLATTQGSGDRQLILFSFLVADGLYYQGDRDDYGIQNVALTDPAIWAVYGGRKWRVSPSNSPLPSTTSGYALVQAWTSEQLDAMPTETGAACQMVAFDQLPITLPKPAIPELTVIPPNLWAA